MDDVAVLFLLVLGGVLLTPLAERWRLPAPVLTTIYGLGLALLPFIPHFSPTADLILPLLLPPLLYAAARRSSWGEFIANLKPIVVLAVVLVFVMAAAVAALAVTLHPVLPLGAAIVLGVIVSPPDVAAVTTIASRLGLPRHLVTVMEGEGLFNDVTALTLYQVAVAGVVTGSFSYLGSVGVFGYAAVVAVMVGFAVAAAARWWMDRVADARLVTGASLLLPYASYITADQVGASGVLAVLTTAFYLAAKSRDPDDVEARLTQASFWDVTELMVTAITFGFVGLEFIDVLETLPFDDQSLLWKALTVSLGVILVRALWMTSVMWATRWRLRWTGRPISWRTTLVLSWSGMRGVVTIVTALALPTVTAAGQPFPGRDQIVFVALVVVMVTLLLQGLTLPWLIGAIGLRRDAHAEEEMWHRVTGIARQAAMHRLDELDARGLEPEVAQRLRDWQTMLTVEISGDSGGAEDPDNAKRARQRRQLHECEADMMSAARAALLRARHRPGIDPNVIDQLLLRLDRRAAGRG